MLLGSVQISGEEVGDIEVRDICKSLESNSIRLLSLRGCEMEDGHFQRLSESLKGNESLVQLNLNLGVVSSKDRIRWLADGLMENSSLTALLGVSVPRKASIENFKSVLLITLIWSILISLYPVDLLHGTPMGDEGFGYLLPALEGHPKLKSIDLGDCGLGDEGIRSVCSLISNTEDKPGLLELTLTGNREVTQVGWTQLAMSIANGCSLRSLFLDYNNIGDFGAGVFAVALAASKTLHVVDFEGCGITDAGAELLCDSLTGYATSIKELNLAENKISEDVLEEVKECLLDNNQVAGNLSSRGRSSPQGKAKTPEQ